MTYTDAIEQAVERQLEIERKAAAWDRLHRMMRRSLDAPVTVDHLLDLMAALEQDTTRPRHG